MASNEKNTEAKRTTPPDPNPITDKLLAEMFNAIKAGEAAMVEKDAKRVAEAAAAGTPVKQLNFDQLLALRRKYNPHSESICPATADHAHVWSPLHECGRSWHGPVYGKDCTGCGYSWSSH